MIDRDGYRPNVGIIICNWKNEVFWGKRVKEHSWQFPQGGIKAGETPERGAMPCVGLLTVEDFLQEVADLNIAAGFT